MEVTTVNSSAAAEAGRLDAEFWMTHCHDCRNEFPPKPTTGASGYAIDASRDVRICYACADDQQRAWLKTESLVLGYVSGDGKVITTWTGGHLMTVTSEVTHGDWRSAFGPLSYYRATDANGTRWYGKGSGRSMCIKMRKSVAK